MRGLRVHMLVVWACALAGCGPHLNRQVLDARSYVSDEACSQGPHTITFPVDEGARWGESVELYACGPRRIAGHYELVVGEHTLSSGEFGDIADNQRCVVDRAAPATAGGEGGRGSSGGEGVAAADTATTAETSEAVTRTRTLRVVEQDPGLCDNGVRTYITDMGFEFRLASWGDQIELRVWSVEPNDLDGLIFRAIHARLVPNVSDERWEEHLAEEEREWEERQARAERRQREEDEGDDVLARAARCRDDPDRDECRLAYSEEPEAPREGPPEGPPPAPREESRPPPPSTNAEWVNGYWHWNGRAWGWLAGQWRVPERDILTGQTVHAPHAPPSPRAETRPMSPDPSAVWCDGYWQWSASGWVWVAGSWQLPPGLGYTWRAAGWRPTGSGVVFLPGGWVVGMR